MFGPGMAIDSWTQASGRARDGLRGESCSPAWAPDDNYLKQGITPISLAERVKEL